MAEYAEYRLVYEMLYKHFQKGWVTLKEVAEYDQCDPRTVRERYGLKKGAGGIDVAVLAQRKCARAH